MHITRVGLKPIGPIVANSLPTFNYLLSAVQAHKWHVVYCFICEYLECRFGQIALNHIYIPEQRQSES